MSDTLKQLEAATARAEKAEADNAALVAMLKHLPCPNKCVGGAIQVQMRTIHWQDDFDIEPCQWCDALNHPHPGEAMLKRLEDAEAEVTRLLCRRPSRR